LAVSGLSLPQRLRRHRGASRRQARVLVRAGRGCAGLAALLEATDPSVHTARQLQASLRLPVLAADWQHRGESALLSP
jgi:hypothetical protein